MTPICTVVVATYNRAASLRAALDCLLHQSFEAPYEVVVVDNASTDASASVVNELRRRHANLHYALESLAGPAIARNTGVALAKAGLILFTDDDIRPTYTWLAAMNEAAAAHPDVDVFSGRILPAWPGPLPSWLTREHWTGALALQDYGDVAFVVGLERPLSLATANMAIRKRTFDEFGGFNSEFRFAEDTELLVRMWRAGRRSMYVPDAVVLAPISPDRMTKAYHRQWHRRNARWSARTRFDECFDGSGHLLAAPVESATLFGVPGYLYRQFVSTSFQWLRAAVTLQSSRAFLYEKQLWQQSSYIWERMRKPDGQRRPLSAELGQLSRRAGRRLFSHP